MLEVFLTGCDKNTEWQLPWFVHNYRKHNTTPLVVADFGMSKEMREIEGIDLVIDVKSEAKGWFKKPRAMLDATKLDGVKKVCWLDTDCQVFGDISPIFDLTVPFKIGMVEDRPWTKRRGEYGAWYNSGVVVWEGKPNILRAWAEQCINDGWVGDQETLYAMMGGDEIMKMSIIEPLPHKYNTLRLDYVDNIAVKNPLIVHHTGKKGKEVIKEQIDV